MLYSDTGKTRSDVEKDRFMINQEKDRPGQIRRSVQYQIIPTWDDVHAEFVKTYPEDEIIFDKTNVQRTMQSMYELITCFHEFFNNESTNCYSQKGPSIKNVGPF